MADENGRSSANKKLVHWHGCRSCSTPYEDTCADNKNDGKCANCRGGYGFPLLIENARPRFCCTQSSRPATKDELKTYRLAGARTWFICRACARTQPFDPRPERQP